MSHLSKSEPETAPLTLTSESRPIVRLDAERADWDKSALASLARAYGPDEPEYTLDDIKRALEL